MQYNAGRPLGTRPRAHTHNPSYMCTHARCACTHTAIIQCQYALIVQCSYVHIIHACADVGSECTHIDVLQHINVNMHPCVHTKSIVQHTAAPVILNVPDLSRSGASNIVFWLHATNAINDDQPKCRNRECESTLRYSALSGTYSIAINKNE